MRTLFTAAVLLFALGAGTASLYAPDTDPEAMRAKYGGAEARFAAGDGLDIHYRVSGPKNAPALVMIHGTAASLHSWEPLRARLQDRYRIIAYDQPGHGLTGPHQERRYDMDVRRRALDAVYAAEGINEAVLIGSSLGGHVAWREALARPERTLALVLISPSGAPMDEERAGNIGFALLQSRAGRFAGQWLTPRFLVKRSLQSSVGDPALVTEEDTDRYWELLRYPGNRRAAGDQFAQKAPAPFAEIGKITAPTLILWGEEDRLIPVETAAAFDSAIPNSELRLYPGIGHLPMEEAPITVAYDIKEFLERRLPKTAPEPLSLEGTWELLSLNGEAPAASSESGRLLGLVVRGEVISAGAGCNSGVGALSFVKPSRLETSGLTKTEVLCGPELMRQEEGLFALMEAASARLDGDKLTLEGDDGQSATFLRAPSAKDAEREEPALTPAPLPEPLP